MDFENNWLLSLMIFLPLAGAAAVMAVPKAKEEMIKAIALITAVITALLGAFLSISSDYSKPADLPSPAREGAATCTVPQRLAQDVRAPIRHRPLAQRVRRRHDGLGGRGGVIDGAHDGLR